MGHPDDVIRGIPQCLSAYVGTAHYSGHSHETRCSRNIEHSKLLSFRVEKALLNKLLNKLRLGQFVYMPPLSRQQTFTRIHYMLLWNLKVHHRVHKSQPLNSPPYAGHITIYILQVSFSITLPPTLWSAVTSFCLFLIFFSAPYAAPAFQSDQSTRSQTSNHLLFWTVPYYTALNM
jgi:hypothetical protein